MKRIGKKGILILLVFMLLFTPAIDSAGLGITRAQQNLQYWASSADKVYFRGPYVSVYYTSLCSSGNLTASKIRGYIATAETTWSSLGLSFSWSSTQNGADITVKGIDEDTAENMGYDESVYGYTVIPSESLEGVGVGNYNGTPKYISEITGATFLYLFNHGDMKNSSTVCNRIAIHEFTHSLGYYGHYNVYGSLMYSDAGAILTGAPSTNERNHLKQIYDYQL